jgi:hypothetical protein
MARLKLPPKKDKNVELVEALTAEMAPAEMEANVHLTSWKIIDSYLAGIRKYKILDRWSGNLSIAYENAKGELDLRYEEILNKYLVEVGRYLKMDNSPIATKKGESLGALRNAGIANATLGALGAKLPLKLIHRRAVIPFIKYGTVGVNHVETGTPDFPDLFEVVSPRQLRGLPAWVDGIDNLYGIARKRWVPFGWAEERAKTVYKRKLPADRIESTLHGRSVPFGAVPPEQTADYADQAGIGSIWRPIPRDVLGPGISRGKDYYQDERAVKDGRYYVPLEEIYIYDDSMQFVSRFIIKIGDYILHDEDFEAAGLRVLCPLHVARHTDIGKFFARGFIAPLMPINDQMEKMLQSLFKNVQELDMFGTLFVPGASGIDTKKWRTGPRPRVEKFEPDPINPNLQPFQLQPVTSGKLPADIYQISSGIMDKLASQGPFMQGQTSGRVDSAAGLGFLFNTGNIPLGLPANGLADAYVGVYSRMLQVAKDRLGPGETVQIAVVDDAIAGVIIDPGTGNLRLADNPIPEPWEVNIDVRDRTPRDRDIRKQELLQLYTAQLVDDTRFWITAFQENLDFPGAPKEVWETWRKATWQIVMLFRDGKTPGEVTLGEHTQNADIQLIAVQTFMSKIEFSLASPEVRQAFESWKMDLEVLAGKSFPAGLPSPEMIAPGQPPGMPTGMLPPGGPGQGPSGPFG